jgi:hypothetical protein
MTERVEKVFDEADESRAETIAKTETSRARHAAEIETAKESGVVKGKKWLKSADCCPACDAMTEKTIPLDQPYTTTDYGPVGGPPLHPNCACSQTFELIDDYKPQE